MKKKLYKYGALGLGLAKALDKKVNEEFANKSFFTKLSPVTCELLEYWFLEDFCVTRTVNFHKGQKQAILNIIYICEVLNAKNIVDLYKIMEKEGLTVDKELLLSIEEKIEFSEVANFLIKMATGTGKTFVINAVMIWQYLNYLQGNFLGGFKYHNNFLIIAPSVMVYDRLLQSFKGKELQDGTYDFEKSDVKKYSELFLPKHYRGRVFSFWQNAIKTKIDLGKGDSNSGLIGILNYHQLMVSVKDDLECYLPLKPNIRNDLETLDGYGNENFKLEFLQKLPSLCVINDEAHHIYIEDSKEDKKWNESLKLIFANKKNQYLQLDFSATPFLQNNSKAKKEDGLIAINKEYLVHIITNFDFKDAVTEGLVKMVSIDKIKEFNYEFEGESEKDKEKDKEDIDKQKLENLVAIRDSNREVLALGETQRLMIKAGIHQLQALEKEFLKLNPEKYPKMLIMLEDTKVSASVKSFLIECGFAEDEFLTIDSSIKGEVSEKEWDKIKYDLFNIDSNPKIKIIISVLMLREGFDVSNICIIVPLRKSKSKQLVEQTVGRGLRLMWREQEYLEEKLLNIEKVIKKKEKPNSYLDILTIIDHPQYQEFYNESLENLIITEGEIKEHKKLTGDLTTIYLKENYADYDLFFPKIIQSEVKNFEINVEEIIAEMNPCEMDFESLQKRAKSSTIVKQEILVKTYLDEYKVDSSRFKAVSYNQYLPKLLQEGLKNKNVAIWGNVDSKIIRILDLFIRNKLFKKTIEINSENLKILMLDDVIGHILWTLRTALLKNLEKNTNEEVVEIAKYKFSCVKSCVVDLLYSLEVSKNIFERVKYPRNKGNFERDFIEFIDRNSLVKKFVKIDNYLHGDANIEYFTEKNYLAKYYPDFLINIDKKLYIVETKATAFLLNADTKAKEKAAIEFVNQVNKAKDREFDFEYVILDDKYFYEKRDRNYSILDMLEDKALKYIDGKLI